MHGTYPSGKPTAPSRLDAVDSLRGIAACIVAFIYHLRNFGLQDAPWYVAHEPLKSIYDWGSFGVDLFFVLSGFIFAKKYAQLISDRTTSAYEFFVLRFSRLYPLHVATLATMLLIGSAASLTGWAGTNADTFHLFLNLTLTQYLGFEKGFSFNTPAWTISLEALCYAVFFVAALFSRPVFVAGCFVMICLGSIMQIKLLTFPLANSTLGQALVGFFAGCLVFQAYDSRYVNWLRWVALGLLAHFAFNVANQGSLFGAALPYYNLTFDLIVFPCLLLVCISFQRVQTLLSVTPLRFLGAISFTIYMVHFPIQTIINIAYLKAGVPVPASNLFFVAAYVAVVLAASAVIHYRFEVPMQNLIRRRMLGKGTSATPSAHPATANEAVGGY